MDLETFQIVARPKVEGTINLDQLFKDEPLDFFIPFSSIVATTGNMGQMAYSAGNCFTKAIVAQRRARGLAGSVIDISRVLGVGYVERETKVQGRLTKQEAERLMTRSGTLAMSEPDLHQLFAEAVLAGRPSSTKNPEIITGVHPLTSEEADLAFWGGNIKFSHLIQNNRDAGVEKDSQSAKVPVKAELAAAKSLEDAARIINTKLKVSLYLSADQPIATTVPLSDLGVDSLMAVEIRTWSLAELSVDLPVLKILGGASVGDMVADIMAKLPQDITESLEVKDGGVPSSNTTSSDGAGSVSSSRSSFSEVEVPTPLEDSKGKLAVQVSTREVLGKTAIA
ncbi:MAG: hypothetical protein Q9214_003188 [Letrouitia sp. 1 TL-2023]